ncbi:MAG TPA: cytochrome c oxidase subunit II [Gemmatimonadales bacterium]|jgi:cytochrome c oxidase subunit 2
MATREAQLGWALIAIGVIVVLIITALVLTGTFRHRGEAAEQIRREGEGIRWITIGGIVLPAIVLLAAFGLTLKVLRSQQLPSRSSDVTIEIVGHRWWWELRYQGANSQQHAVTANEIHIPVGRPVRVALKSGDVIHSFWVPELGGKTDLIPGQENVIWLQADRAGVYRGQCAEFCGAQHAQMALMVVAEAPDDFARWFALQQEGAPAPTGAALRGRDAFVGGPCALCHEIRGTEAGGRQGPDLTHLAGRKTIAAGLLPNDRGKLTAWILDPQTIKPGSLMPRMRLNDQDVAAMVEYLETLQ